MPVLGTWALHPREVLGSVRMARGSVCIVLLSGIVGERELWLRYIIAFRCALQNDLNRQQLDMANAQAR